MENVDSQIELDKLQKNIFIYTYIYIERERRVKREREIDLQKVVGLEGLGRNYFGDLRKKKNLPKTSYTNDFLGFLPFPSLPRLDLNIMLQAKVTSFFFR